MGDTQLVQLAGTDRNPVQETEYRNLLRAQGIPFREEGNRTYVEGFGYGGHDAGETTRSFFGTGGVAQQNAIALAQKKAREQAIAPAVASLQASIPETSAKFQTERTRLESNIDPLKQRYDAILQDLTRRQTVAETGATKVTNRELARRGVQLDSTLAGQEQEAVLNPIRSEYAGLSTQANLSREEQIKAINDLIAGLTPQEVEANRTIQNAIAQLQAGAGNAAIDDAFRQLQLQEQQRQFNETTNLTKQELALKELAAKAGNTDNKLYTVGKNTAVYNPATGQFTYPTGYNSSSGGSSNNGSLEDLWNALNT